MKKQKILGQHLKNFTFIKVLGEGAWATVYQAIDDRDRSTVAVKVIARSLMRQTPKLEELVKTQIKVLKSCHNENVIRFVSNFKSEHSIFIAMEFCNGGDLENYLDKKKTLSEDEATMFLKQILNGFKGLHEVGAMHRDFKVANVLLHNRVCKIADLGFAKQMEKKALTKTILGTSLTMAPQVLDEKPYGFEADIWSIGVVFYQMLYGKYPYEGSNDYDILRKIKNSRPDYRRVQISDKAKDFIERCLTVDPKKRIRWQQIYEHSLLIKNEPNLLYGLKPGISLNQNRNFYNKKGLPEKNLYPDVNKDNFDVVGIQFDDAGKEIDKSESMNVILQEVVKNKEKQKVFEQLESSYLQKRNNIFFIVKYISPYIPQFKKIKANHEIALFIMSKKAYIDMKNFFGSYNKNENIFKIPHFFEEFTQSIIYSNLQQQIQSDLKEIQRQCLSYCSDIKMCSKQIEAEFQMEKPVSPHFYQLVKDTIDQYWLILAESLSSMKEKKKHELMKLLQALYYYKSSYKTDVDQFDRMMAVIDFEETEKDIAAKYTASLS